jgi:hypothetical protein
VKLYALGDLHPSCSLRFPLNAGNGYASSGIRNPDRIDGRAPGNSSRAETIRPAHEGSGWDLRMTMNLVRNPRTLAEHEVQVATIAYIEAHGGTS